MSIILKKIGLEQSSDQGKLLRAYAGKLERGVTPWLRGFSADNAYWRELAGVSAARRASEPNAADWKAVVEDVRSLSARLGTGDEVLGKLRGAGAGDVQFVVTGQQPGTLGGPLLAIYKAVTAVALAAHLEGLLGCACVPLYWCGGDDSDFQEIRPFNCLDPGVTPFGSLLAQSAHTAGMPTGDIPLDAPRQIWDGVGGFIDGFEEVGFVKRVVKESFDRAGDNGELASAILVGITGGKLAVVDGRSGAVRRFARDLFAEYVEDEAAVKKEIMHQGIELDAAGFHAQLKVGSDSGVFLIENGVRKSVTEDLRPRLVDEIRHTVENCSPGVALRNLVQDYVFGPIAVVLGPAEVAYRAQIFRLYDRFDIPRPAAIPRLTATYLPPALASVFDRHGDLAVEELLSNPAEFARKIYELSIPEKAAGAARELTDRVDDAVKQFSQSLEGGTAPRALGKLRSKLRDLQNRTAQTTGAIGEIGKSLAVEQWPFLPELEAIIRPGGKPQERSLSVLVPFLFGGETASADLMTVAREYTDDLLDGRANHVVYSSK